LFRRLAAVPETRRRALPPGARQRTAAAAARRRWTWGQSPRQKVCSMDRLPSQETAIRPRPAALHKQQSRGEEADCAEGSQLFDQHLRAPPAPVVAVAPAWRQVIGRAQAEAALLQEIVERLRRKAEQLGRPTGPRLRLGELHQAGAETLVLVIGMHAHAR